jgi:type I restriction enzyme, S subunit
MIAGLKPYPAMKDSGVPWLGEVPQHWDVPRLGALVWERGETNDDNSVVEVLSVMRERGVIPYAEKGNVGNKKSDDITRYKIVRPDDIVVNCMNVIIGSVGLSKYTGCLSPVYYVLTRRSDSDEPRYLNACFQTKPFQLSLVRIGNGILAHRMRIPMELLKCEPFPRPPAAEQAAIVRFLDHADRRIRRYTRAKQKLIKLLEEQKQAIIHRAVTRGLDPDVRLKPSGVEWLGDVPEHWELHRAKHLFREVDHRSPTGTEVLLSLRMYRGLVPHQRCQSQRKPLSDSRR